MYAITELGSGFVNLRTHRSNMPLKYREFWTIIQEKFYMMKFKNLILLLFSLFSLKAMAEPVAAARELAFKEAKKQQVTHSMVGIRDSLVFYALADQKAVLVLRIDHKDIMFAVTGTVYLFAPDTTEEGMGKWINNQHSDGLFPEVPEPIFHSQLPEGNVSIFERKLMGKEKQRLDNKEFSNYEVKLSIKEHRVQGKFHLVAFEDVAKVFLELENS